MTNILIYGASGHSRMIVDIINKNKSHNIIGFLDSHKPKGQSIHGYEILGNSDDIPHLIEKYGIKGVVIGIGDNYSRKLAYEKIIEKAPRLEFFPIIHPTAIIADDVNISDGTVVMPGAIINSNAKMGILCILNTKSSLGHDCNMGDFSSLASGATVGGNVNIGVCSAICLGASIINNINIGNHTVIGSGALVVKSIGDLKQAIGVPIEVIKHRDIDSKYLDRE